MIGPIRPEDIPSAKIRTIPEEVFRAFNDAIALCYDNGVAEVNQENVIMRICKNLSCARQEVFEQGWLNVEDAYRAVGWEVLYDKPAYNEFYPASFTFRNPKW